MVELVWNLHIVRSEGMCASNNYLLCVALLYDVWERLVCTKYVFFFTISVTNYIFCFFKWIVVRAVFPGVKEVCMCLFIKIDHNPFKCRVFVSPMLYV